MPNILEKKNKSNLEDQQASLDSLDNLSQNQTKDEAKSEPESGFMNILGECLTFAPLVYEKWTKKKLPAMGGTIGEIQQAVTQLALQFQQLSTSLVTIVSNQNKIFQRIVNLENNAQNGFLSLNGKIENMKSLKLTHERERKQIEYNQPNNSALIEEPNEEYE